MLRGGKIKYNCKPENSLRGLLSVLIVEDSEDDLEFLLRELRRGGFEPVYRCVDSFKAMEHALEHEKWDIVISDFDMPSFSGLAALALLSSMKLDLPFIVVSGAVDEEKIIEVMRAHASDYIMKGNLSRLNSAVERELREARQRRAHRRTEEDLRKLSVAVEQSPATVVITDLNGNIEYVNPKFTELTGYSYHEAIGRTPNMLNSGRHPKEFYEELWETLLAGNTWQGEFQNRKKNGELYWENATISPITNEDGATTHFIAVKEDISARKLAEQELVESELRYRTLFEELKDVVFVRSSEGRFLDINPAGVELFGYASRQEMMALDFSTDIYVNPENLSSFEAGIEKEGFVRDFEAVMKRKDGSEIMTNVTATAILDSAGHVTGYRAILRDMTSFKMLERQFVEAQKMEAVGVLAGGVAHDFNNILTAVILYAGGAIEKLGDSAPETTADINEVLKAAYRATDLTRQLLIFGRKQRVEFKPLVVNSVLEGVAKMIGRLIGEDISLVLDLDEDIRTIMADKCNLEQVLMNLVVNARDAMPEGGSIVLRTKNVTLDESECRAIPEATPGDFICLSIEDSGEGIDKETCQHIFEPFYTTKETGKGSGLGLAVVHGIVKRHGGWITVDTNRPVGTTFNVYLPVSTQKAPQVEESGMLFDDYYGSDQKILLVEDDKDVRTPACRILTECGYAVQEAASADEALAIFEREEGDFDLLFSDVILTGKSGLYLADELLGRNPSMGVLLTSGHIDNKSQWPAIKDRGLDFISKPYSVVDLLSAIKGSLILSEIDSEPSLLGRGEQ
ncbi:hypothetical protein MNBD_DELTA01-1699 [hydrothermal vent metagenome]|uniref:Uncharacterized protein n=1 Tax=hydrothermal vent metagenome TaxID=652676 RepID=A0A3B0RB42_9ZZZZ